MTEQLSLLPDVPPVTVEPKQHITTNQAARELRELRKTDGFRDPTPHVCDTSRFGYCVPCRLRAMREGGKVQRVTA